MSVQHVKHMGFEMEHACLVIVRALRWASTPDRRFEASGPEVSE